MLRKCVGGTVCRHSSMTSSQSGGDYSDCSLTTLRYVSRHSSPSTFTFSLKVVALDLAREGTPSSSLPNELCQVKGRTYNPVRDENVMTLLVFRLLFDTNIRGIKGFLVLVIAEQSVKYSGIVAIIVSLQKFLILSFDVRSFSLHVRYCIPCGSIFFRCLNGRRINYLNILLRSRDQSFFRYGLAHSLNLSSAGYTPSLYRFLRDITTLSSWRQRRISMLDLPRPISKVTPSRSTRWRYTRLYAFA